MTLFVMSAYVAFNGFPGQDVEDPIGSLLLQERQAPVSVPVQPVRVNTTPATVRHASSHRRHAHAHRALGPRASTGPVKQRLPAQAPASSPPPASSGGAPQDAVQQTTSQLPATPKVPSTTDVLPDINLPKAQTPAKQQLPIDTSGLTKIVDGR
jgi:hypothetical protein